MLKKSLMAPCASNLHGFTDSHPQGAATFQALRGWSMICSESFAGQRAVVGPRAPVKVAKQRPFGGAWLQIHAFVEHDNHRRYHESLKTLPRPMPASGEARPA